MSAVETRRLPERSLVSRVAAFLAMAVACLVLIGWIIDSPLLKSVLPGLASMKPNTALGLVFAGASLWFLTSAHAAPWWRTAGVALACFVTVLGAVTLAEILFNFDFGIDQLLLSHAHRAANPGQNRMSPYTALNCMLLGASLLALSRRKVMIFQTLASAVMAGSYLSLLGYLYGVAFLYRFYSTTSVALHTAATILILSGGVLWAMPSAGIPGSITAATYSGLVSRRLLPLTLVFPLFGWLRVEGQRREIYGTETGIAILVTSTTIVFNVGVLLVARILAKREEERQQMQSSLAEREMRLRATFEQVVDGILTINERGVIESANPAVERLFGYAASDLLGKNISMLMPAPYRDEHDGYLAAYRSTGIRKIIGIGREVHARRKDGSIFPIDLSVSEFTVGGARRFTGIVRDISERQRSQETARHLAAIVDSSADAIVGKTLDGIVTSWNRGAEELFGYTAAEMIGQSVLRLIPPDRPEDLSAILTRIRSGQRVDHYETERIAKDGRRLTVSLTVSPLVDHDGRVMGASKIARDITENRRLEARLRQSQKMEAIGQLAGGIAHDFNNLLTVINGYAGLKLRDLRPQDPMFQALSQISAAGQRGAALTHHLLAFSRKQVMQPRVVDVNALVQGMRGLLAPMLRADVNLRTLPDPSLPPIKADPHQIEQVLMNLVINGSDAMPRGGVLTIETAYEILDRERVTDSGDLPAGPYSVIAVSDTGLGMSASVQARIFEPFFTTKPTGQGTGLGLATVFGIVKQSGGHVSVYSEVGVGTTFRVYLPATAERVAEEFPKPEGECLEGGETILLVEDDASLRGYAAGVLRSLGYVVYEASDGAEALRIAEGRAGTIGLVVTDVVMPNIGGSELADRLRSFLPQMRVLFISGYTENAITRDGALEPGAHFLAKPFSPEQLGLKVREVLHSPRHSRAILLVDDDPGVLKLMSSILREAHYQVWTAANGKEAVSMCSDKVVHLVITDMVMPEQEGLETIRYFRKEMPQMKIIAMSGAIAGYLNAATLLGAHAVIEKPVTQAELLRVVAGVLGQS